MDEIDYEVISHLNNLVRITSKILDVYKLLIILDCTSLKSPNYNSTKDSLIDRLVTLKFAENEEYEYINESYYNITTILDYLDEMNIEDNEKNHYNNLIFTRIYEKLSKQETYKGIEENDEGIIKDITKFKKYQIISEGFDEEDALNIYLELSTLLSNSMTIRYASMLEDEIKNNENGIIFLRMRYEEAFANPGSLEDELIKVKFGRLPRTFDKDLDNNLGINPKTFKKFIHEELMDCLLDILNKINNSKNEFELSACIVTFKSYLLYASEYDIKRAIGAVSSIIKDNTIKEELTSYIYQSDKYKQEQNIDLNNIKNKGGIYGR